MYQDLLKEWIKTIPNKANRKYLQDMQELRVFAEWLDKQAAQHSLHLTGGTPHANWCATRNGDICDCGGWQPRQQVS